MQINEMFHHTQDEIKAQMLLPGKPYEEVFQSQDAVPELEKLFHDRAIPKGGVLSTNNTFDCGTQVKELISYGLFDPSFKVTSREHWENEGKILADTTTAIFTGMMMDRIHKDKSHNPNTLSWFYGQANHMQIDEADKKIQFADRGAYLIHAQVLLLKDLRSLLEHNLKNTVNEIKSLLQDDPLRIMYNNFMKLIEYGNQFGLIDRKPTPSNHDAYSFIQRGIISMVDVAYATLEVIPSVAKRDIPEIKTKGGITREQLVNGFTSSQNIFQDLRRADLDLFSEAVPSASSGILTIILDVNKRQDQLARFKFRPEHFGIACSKNLDKLGTLILNEKQKPNGDVCRRAAFMTQQANPVLIRPEPRKIYFCPAGSLRAFGKPNVIKDVHTIATKGLRQLNKQY